MADTQRRLILGNGEQYIEPVTKPTSGRSPEPPRNYDEARDLVRAGVTTALADFESLPAAKKLPDEAVFCLRLHPDAIAKSYDPVAIFNEVPELRNVGDPPRPSTRACREGRQEQGLQRVRCTVHPLDRQPLLSFSCGF